MSEIVGSGYYACILGITTRRPCRSLRHPTWPKEAEGNSKNTLLLGIFMLVSVCYFYTYVFNVKKSQFSCEELSNP